jgi:CheY-like chemotaxis protein
LIAGSNGTDVCRDLKGSKAYRHIPIIMISALHDAKQLCLDAGAEAFIPKPFEMTAILRKVSQFMNAESEV